MSIDPRETLDKAPMSLLQMVVVVITCMLNGLDGFDVLSISFASNGIAKEWDMMPAELGVVLSMELIGMAIGSIILGGVADKVGRRRTTLGCLSVMAVGMVMTTVVGNVTQLSICRIFTGFGLGGLLAAINAMSAEFANRKKRHMCVSLMSIGYPIGGVLGGFIAAWFLRHYEWRYIFYFGSAITAFFIPVVFFIVPESVQWLVRAQPKDALKRANEALRRMGHAIVDALPELTPEARKKSLKDIFSPGLAGITVMVTIAYFLHVTTYYFILKWAPRAAHSFWGFDMPSAANVLTCANIGGVVGGVVFTLLTLRYDIKKLTIGVMFLGAAFIALFGSIPANLIYAGLVAFGCGFFGNPAIVGMFALFAHVFPTHIRAAGTGFSVGIGRGGAILSPIIVGFLIEGGFSLAAVTAIISIGGFIGAAVLLFVKLEK